jgi:hypothetical protein
MGRLTIAGIRINFRKIGSLFNYRNKNINFVIDIEANPSKNITYDVSRDRIIGKGIFKIRKEIISIVKRYFKETGVNKIMSEENQFYFERIEHSKLPQEPLDDNHCQYIINKINKEGWKTGIHKEIAEELKISNYSATKIITALIYLKKLKKD